MTADPATRIRTSFAQLSRRAPQLIDLFYSRLFAARPGIRALFPENMTSQRVHMVAALTLIAENAGQLETLAGPLMQLGERHVKYGVRAEHYPLVRDALVEAMAIASGPEWTDELATDWRIALDCVAGFMVKGAERATLQQAA